MTTTPDSTASILIVDDMEENLVALEAVLGSLSQHVVRARSGEEALKAMLRQEFAVVLIDVLMPGMNGFETAANIKGLDQTKDVPIILLTGASVDPNYAYRGYTVGAADFLVKPFDPWLLRTKVNVFLELHRKNRQLAAQAEQLKRLLTSEEAAEQSGPAPVDHSAPAAAPPASCRPAPPVDTVELPEHPVAAEAPPPDTGIAPGQDALTATGAGEAARLAEVVGQLTEIEGMLRDAPGAEPPGLADRIAELEQAVGRMLVSRGT
ncbi:two-component system response regulator [Streptomyces sp. NPDC053427]|uniref:two-component system response regulator n=1 Tax=Streptomyces sp. NPDC053427 TaxID=3365701 RepID=UPI0037D36587